MSSLIRNQITTGLKDEKHSISGTVQNSKKGKKAAVVDFSLGHPALPSASSDGGRWGSLTSVDSLSLS